MTNHIAPIQNLDSFDLVGELKEGGVDLVIVCSGPLDASPATLELIEQKVMSYLRTIAHEGFLRMYPSANHGRTQILLSCEHSVSEAARGLVVQLSKRAELQNVELRIVKRVA